MSRRRPWFRGPLAGVAALIAAAAAAGTLAGPILDAGVRATLVDVVQLPFTAGGQPRTRVNVLREAPDGSGRLFANDLRGPLYAIDGAAVSTYLDLAVLLPALKTAPGLASGFVSFAFHPEWAGNGIFYTVHTEPVGALPPTHGPAISAPILHHSVLTEWTASDPSANAFGGSSREILRVAAPSPLHNLGEIAFRPDAVPGDADYGLLYLANGDYGSVDRGEPEQLQRLDTVFGAVLRIDPRGGTGAPYSYGIPAENPFASDGDPATLGEIYAYGFRNGHRLSWRTGGPGGLYVTDVGQSNLEEVNLLVPGANYGWPLREGNRALDPLGDLGQTFPLPPNDASFGITYPVAMYDHEDGRANAGGFVVETHPASALHGRYVFGDIVSGRIFYAAADDLAAADDGDPATTAPVYELTLVHEGVEKTLLQVVREEVGNPTLGRTDLRATSTSPPSRTASCAASFPSPRRASRRCAEDGLQPSPSCWRAPPRASRAPPGCSEAAVIFPKVQRDERCPYDRPARPRDATQSGAARCARGRLPERSAEPAVAARAGTGRGAGERPRYRLKPRKVGFGFDIARARALAAQLSEAEVLRKLGGRD